jgi:hypothetical protein
MTHSPSTTGLGQAYNAFLFASLTTDDSGAAPLSTVSALARLDLDPWREAAELTRLSQATATRRLAALLARASGGQPLPDPEAVAVRLVALLPERGGPAVAAPDRSAPPGGAFGPTFVAIGIAVALGAIVAGFLAAPSDRATGPTRVAPTPATAAAATSPPTQPR